MFLQKLRNRFQINTISRRMRTAFMSIILLLIVSGAMSLFELERVSHDTEEILTASKTNVDLAGEMISALNEQNDAMIYMAVLGDESEGHRISCNHSISHLSKTTEAARKRMLNTDNPAATDSLIIHTNRINSLAKDFLDKRVHLYLLEESERDTISVLNTQTWYADEYKTEYLNVSQQIRKYMTGTNSTLGPEVNRLSNTARRAVTPVFISLVVMLVIVLLLYFFMKSYFINPILRINRSLGDFLTYKMPFDESIPSRDELATLRDRIAQLIAKFK